MFSGSPESGYTLVVDFLECLRSDLPSRKRKQVVSEPMPHHKIRSTMGGKSGRIIEDEMR